MNYKISEKKKKKKERTRKRDTTRTRTRTSKDETINTRKKKKRRNDNIIPSHPIQFHSIHQNPHGTTKPQNHKPPPPPPPKKKNHITYSSQSPSQPLSTAQASSKAPKVQRTGATKNQQIRNHEKENRNATQRTCKSSVAVGLFSASTSRHFAK